MLVKRIELYFTVKDNGDYTYFTLCTANGFVMDDPTRKYLELVFNKELDHISLLDELSAYDIRALLLRGFIIHLVG